MPSMIIAESPIKIFLANPSDISGVSTNGVIAFGLDFFVAVDVVGLAMLFLINFTIDVFADKLRSAFSFFQYFGLVFAQHRYA